MQQLNEPILKITVPNEKQSPGLRASQPLLFLGSCFSENIGQHLLQAGYQSCTNPFGVLYNPASIKNTLQTLLSPKPWVLSDLERNQDVYFHYAFSSHFTDTDAPRLLSRLNALLENSARFFSRTDVLLLTFGTAWVYRLNQSGAVVANCHKMPADHFTRELLGVDEIVSSYRHLIENLKRVKPDCKIIFTISPVRHLRDGAVANQHSKAILICAVQELLEIFKDTCYYFPAYEIMNDELRDYRFYADDLRHPSSQAIEIIQKRFIRQWIDEVDWPRYFKVQDFLRLKNHRPIQKASQASRDLQSKTEAMARSLENDWHIPRAFWDTELLSEGTVESSLKRIELLQAALSNA